MNASVLYSVLGPDAQPRLAPLCALIPHPCVLSLFSSLSLFSLYLYISLYLSLIPQLVPHIAVPVVGYSGHLRNHRGDAWKSFGTTHWKNSGGTGTKPAAAKVWDNRDGAGRPFGGWTPHDGGRYDEEPDYDHKVKEAEEANELLNLRSMGIRGAMEKVRYTPKGPVGLSW